MSPEYARSVQSYQAAQEHATELSRTQATVGPEQIEQFQQQAYNASQPAPEQAQPQQAQQSSQSVGAQLAQQASQPGGLQRATSPENQQRAALDTAQDAGEQAAATQNTGVTPEPVKGVNTEVGVSTSPIKQEQPDFQFGKLGRLALSR